MDTEMHNAEDRVLAAMLSFVLGGGLIVALLLSVVLAPFAVLFATGGVVSGGGPCAPPPPASAGLATVAPATGSAVSAASSAPRSARVQLSPASLSLRAILCLAVAQLGSRWHRLWLPTSRFAGGCGGLGGIGHGGPSARLPAIADGCLL